MPESLAEIVEDFAAVDGQNKLQLLLEFSRELPELPAHLEQAAMEPVPECQSPLFLSVDSADTDHVPLDHFRRATHGVRPQETMLSVHIIAGMLDDFYLALGLGDAVSPLRLRGMSAMLTRIKRHLR